MPGHRRRSGKKALRRPEFLPYRPGVSRLSERLTGVFDPRTTPVALNDSPTMPSWHFMNGTRLLSASCYHFARLPKSLHPRRLVFLNYLLVIILRGAAFGSGGG